MKGKNISKNGSSVVEHLLHAQMMGCTIKPAIYEIITEFDKLLNTHMCWCQVSCYHEPSEMLALQSQEEIFTETQKAAESKLWIS